MRCTLHPSVRPSSRRCSSLNRNFLVSSQMQDCCTALRQGQAHRCAVLCCAVLCCAVLCCAVLTCIQTANKQTFHKENRASRHGSCSPFVALITENWHADQASVVLAWTGAVLHAAHFQGSPLCCVLLAGPYRQRCRPAKSQHSRTVPLWGGGRVCRRNCQRCRRWHEDCTCNCSGSCNERIAAGFPV